MPAHESASEVSDAAAVVLLRKGPDGPRVLMGKRGTTAAFMPDKFVFPGGRVDAQDGGAPFRVMPNWLCLQRLSQGADPLRARALFGAAIRELAEETGLMLGSPGPWPDAAGAAAAADWERFADACLVPDPTALRFILRAVTPPGRSRRFDARFFLADADAVAGDLDDFSAASGELSQLQWISIAEARHLNLPFITEIVLAEVAMLAALDGPPASVPFFDNSGARPQFSRIA